MVSEDLQGETPEDRPPSSPWGLTIVACLMRWAELKPGSFIHFYLCPHGHTCKLTDAGGRTCHTARQPAP